MATAPTSALAQPAAAKPAPAVSEEQAYGDFEKLKRIVQYEAWAIAGLGLIFALTLPFAQPVYTYYAQKPDGKMLQMIGLDMPNMTNRAVLSWATTSITEIMTMGFGDMYVRLPQQRVRFTKKGWDNYIESFVNLEIGKTFQHSQLVLTTVPSNTPVITWQGVNADNIYQWNIQMPVVMTYATNNNVQRKQLSFITLTIVRVPAEQESSGIAIQSWYSST